MQIAKQALHDATDSSIRGSRARGQLRAKNILQTAQEILSNEGYHSLTLRKIAKTMGISNGNVTYYFANKEQLLQAIISDNLARYDAAFERESRSFPDDPESRIRAYFAFLVDDAGNQKSQRFFYQLWALSSHNAEVARQRDKVYEHFLHQVTAQLKSVRPQMKEDEIRKKSFLMMSLIEGMNVMYGSGKELKEKFGDERQWIVDQILGIAYS